MKPRLPSAIDHEHPESIAKRFVDGFMHPNLEHDAERLAQGYLELLERLEQAELLLDERSVSATDEWLAYRFQQVCDENAKLRAAHAPATERAS